MLVKASGGLSAPRPPPGLLGPSVATVWGSGFSHCFSTMMQLMLGREEWPPPLDSGVRAPLCRSVLVPLSTPFCCLSLHAPSTREGFRGPLSEAGLASGSEATALASAWLPVTRRLWLCLRGPRPRCLPRAPRPRPHSRTCPDDARAPWPRGPRLRASTLKTASEAPRQLIKSTTRFKRRVCPAGRRKRGLAWASWWFCSLSLVA